MNTELTASEIAAIPIRRTWYGIAGTSDSALTPWKLTDDLEVARAHAKIASVEYPSSGPWHVVTLTENLRAPQS